MGLETHLGLKKIPPQDNKEKTELMINLLNHGFIDEFIKLIKQDALSDKALNNPEIRNTAIESMKNLLSRGEVKEAVRLKKYFSFSNDDLEKVVEYAFVQSLKDITLTYKALELKKEFNLTEEFIQEALSQTIIEYFQGNRKEFLNLGLERKYFNLDKIYPEEVESLKKICEVFNLQENFLKETIKKAILSFCKKGYFPEEMISNLLNNFFTEEEILQDKNIKNGIEEKILKDVDFYGRIDQELMNRYNFSLDIFKSSSTQKNISKQILRLLRNDDFEESLKLKKIQFEEWHYDELIKVNDLITYVKFLNNSKIQTTFPNLYKHVFEKIYKILPDDVDLADYFIENLSKYYKEPWVADWIGRALQHYSVAKKFTNETQDNHAVWRNEPWAYDMAVLAENVLDEWEKENQDEYGYSHGAEGFSEKDPYENHPGRFGKKQIELSSLISGAIDGNLTDIHKIDEELKKNGINSYETLLALSDVYEKINSTYDLFLEKIKLNKHIKDEDKQSFTNSPKGLRMTPLLENVRSFISRYLVQSIEGDIQRLPEIVNLAKDTERILKEGFERYIKIHEVDIPLYDKLYEEFDNLRETGRYPLEVFLGRDGIYAWIGRRAQDVARRRKMGLAGRKKLKEMGEIIEIHPKYTVYPRYFRDNLNYETKRQFLEQEGISPEADPLFYDTGYTGTIPEQIMKIMGFEDEDIEKRIRLLSAPSVHRRVKGISENARSEIIEYIEHNAKLEDTAEGLIIDEKTGKIRHVARPTSPEEQFYFMMVKQAIGRHYWLQEKLHHEPSGNINLDSEHYAIRIRQDYKKLLPQEFLHDPKAFFAKHGELMKGSKGKGEYPDEEVILFKLTDGTEIVAKRIELRKAKEARKEFAILIAAKKAGLPTAEPVGFLSGKEDNDGSYLLMKKLEGRSGRKFEKELREAGKYSDEQIENIMKQVAEKNREMADLFRTTLQIDKHWRIKDTIIEFNEETGEIGSVVPIDWERVQNYDPNSPKEIENELV